MQFGPLDMLVSQTVELLSVCVCVCVCVGGGGEITKYNSSVGHVVE
jgi:hypothetical protein